MSRRIAALVIIGMSLGVGGAYAQDSTVEPAAVGVTFMPAGTAYFASKDDQPSFGTNGSGAAVVVTLNLFVGIESR